MIMQVLRNTFIMFDKLMRLLKIYYVRARLEKKLPNCVWSYIAKVLSCVKKKKLKIPPKFLIQTEIHDFPLNVFHAFR